MHEKKSRRVHMLIVPDNTGGNDKVAVCPRTVILNILCLGFSFESNPDVVGEPDYGHARISRTRHGDAQRGDAQA